MPIPVAETGIAWPVDLDKKYGMQNAANFNDVPALRGGAAVTGPLRANEHLVVWMRTAALPAFRKLWGRVLQDLPAGAIVTVSIANRHAPLTSVALCAYSALGFVPMPVSTGYPLKQKHSGSASVRSACCRTRPQARRHSVHCR